MLKTFVATPLAGGIAAVLGWIGAVLIKTSMTEAEFASFRFGWTGAMIGATAAAVIIMLFLAGDMVEPLVLSVVAAGGAALLWNREKLPIDPNRFSEGTTASYWFMVTMMGITFLLLLMGLRVARESTSRARPNRR